MSKPTRLVDAIEGDGGHCPGCDKALPGGGWCERCEEGLRALERALPDEDWTLDTTGKSDGE